MNEDKPVALNDVTDLVEALRTKEFGALLKAADDGGSCGCMGKHDCNGYGPGHVKTKEAFLVEGAPNAADRLQALRRQLGELEQDESGA